MCFVPRRYATWIRPIHLRSVYHTTSLFPAIWLKSGRRKTRRKHAAEDKIRIVLEGVKGEESVAELCRREGISQSLYYKWSKEFLKAGKARLAEDTKRNATRGEVKGLQPENDPLKQLVTKIVQKVFVYDREIIAIELHGDFSIALDEERKATAKL